MSGSLLPLYGRLSERVSVDGDIKQLSDRLTDLDPRNAEQVALLLIHQYFLDHPEAENPFLSRPTSRGHRYPYGIKASSGRGFSFDLEKTPTVLKRILQAYVDRR